MLKRQQLEAVIARELRDLARSDAHAAPSIVRARVRRQAVQLAAQYPAGPEHAVRFAQVVEHHVAAGDVLEHGVGIDEIEAVIGKELEAGARAVMRVRVGRVAQTLARQPYHFVGHIHAVDLREAPAHGAHQASGTAADLKRRRLSAKAR